MGFLAKETELGIRAGTHGNTQLGFIGRGGRQARNPSASNTPTNPYSTESGSTATSSAATGSAKS